MYPPNVRFFINTWTWGYEDILKAISKAFGCKVRIRVTEAPIVTYETLVDSRRPVQV